MRLRALACALLVGGSLAVPGAAVADEGDAYTCADSPSDGAEQVASLVPSRPLRFMGVEAATRRLKREGTKPGHGIKVAVVDSGVLGTSPYAPIDVERPPSYDGARGPLEYSHGTEVAGLVAAHPQRKDLPVGVAPGATGLKTTGVTAGGRQSWWPDRTALGKRFLAF